MNKHRFSSLISVVVLLCLSLLARGQTPITIMGPDPACKGSTQIYTITPTPGITYSWSVSTNGYIATSTISNATIVWGAAGTGAVSINGYNSSSTLVESGTLPVTTLALPSPVITSDANVACHKLNEPNQDDQPISFDTSKCMKVCAYSCVNFTATGAVGSTYAWTVAGGTVSSSSGNTAVICWNGPGTGLVSVEETTVDGCKGIRTICIEITEAPIARIVALPDTPTRVINICDSTEVVFLDKSTSSSVSPIVTWRWDFGDGTYSNAPGGYLTPISHVYTVIGGAPTTYWAKLTVTNACGCSTTDSLEIHVDPSLRYKIECPRVVCEDDTGHYTINAPCPMGIWSVVGGTILSSTGTTVDVLWNNPGADGFGYVYYDAAPCGLLCANAVAKVPIVMKKGVIKGDIIVCPKDQYLYRLPQWPTTEFNWKITTGTGAYLQPTDQRNEIVLNTNNPGIVYLSCDYYNTMLKCGGTATIMINVLDADTIDGPEKACLNTVVTYSLVNGNSGSWVLTKPDNSTQTNSGATINANFDQVGTYVLTITGTTFCPPSPLYIEVKDLPPAPDAIIGPDTFCKGVETKFYADNDIPGTIFNWSMLNGTVNAGSGKETYIKMNSASSGPFVITCWREYKDEPFCKSDPITDTVYPVYVVHSITGPTPVCPNSYHNYSQTYTQGETYEWKIFPEGLGSVASGDGTPTVNVLWNNQTGIAKLVCKMRRCLDFYYDTLTVDIGGFPPLAFTSLPSPVCDGVQFTASVNSGGSSVLWDFGDGNSVVDDASIDYTYETFITSPTVYTVTAIVTNTWGCDRKDTVTSNITVNPSPRGYISSAPFAVNAQGRVYVCNNPPNQTLTFNQTSGPTSATYQWVFNGTTNLGTGVTQLAANFGFYFVEVTAGGCTYTSDTVFVIQQCACSLTISPTVSITGYTHSDCEEFTFTSTHSSTGFISGTTSWYELDPYNKTQFASGEYGATGHFEQGPHTIQYCANFTDGVDTCRICDVISVNMPYGDGLNYDFDCTTTGGNRGVTLQAAGGASNYDFYINNMVTPVASGSSDTYTGYIPFGSNTIRVVSSNGGSTPLCTTTLNINVPTLPVADFSFARDTTCEKEASVMFTNGSSPSPSTPPMTALWDFGDGTGNTIYNPVYRVYDAPGVNPGGVYYVTLTVTDHWGCWDDETKNVPVVQDNLVGASQLSANVVCEGTPVVLSYLRTPPALWNLFPEVYTWYNDKNPFATTTYQPINLFESGYYWVHGENHYGCVENTVPDLLEVKQVPDAYVTGDPEQCVDVPYKLNGYAGSDPNITYSWIIDGLPTALTTPIIEELYTSPGTHTYRVVTAVPDGSGGWCQEVSDLFTVNVHGTPAPPNPSFNIVNCTTYEVQLSATHGSPGTFNWSNGLQGSPVSAYAGGPYQVIFTDDYGCQSRAMLDVPKDPKVYLWIFPTGCWEICPDSLYTIVGPIENSFTRWEYQKNGTPVFSGAGLPLNYTTLHLNALGIFNLFLDNGYCSATSGNMYVDTFGCGNSGHPGGEGKQGVTSVKKGNNTLVSAGALQLLIAPNPANNSTRIDYRWQTPGTNRCIEVYDMTGKLVNRQQADAPQGIWHLSLDAYTPGIYQILMKQDGKTLLHSKLTIVK